MTTTTRELTWTGAQQREHVRMASAALRGDEYPQGNGMLRYMKDGVCLWCIMGALTDVARQVCPELGDWVWTQTTFDNDVVREYADWKCNDGQGTTYGVWLPEPIRAFYGLTSDAVDAMISDNDDGVYTFADFAGVLDRALDAHDAPEEMALLPYGQVFAFND